MTFWKKYNKYFRMAFFLILYGILMFSTFFRLIFLPLREKLGNTIYGCQSYIIILNVLIYTVLFVVSLFLLPDTYYVDFKIFRKTNIVKKLVLIGAGYFGTIILCLFGNMFSLTFGGQIDSINETTINQILSADIAWLYIPVCCVIGPIVEEVVFRGIIQGVIIGNKFRKFESPRVFIGILVSSILFGLIHVVDAGDFVQIFPYFFMGLGLGTVAYLSKSIYPSIIIHVINNTISVLLTLATLLVIK